MCISRQFFSFVHKIAQMASFQNIYLVTLKLLRTDLI
jgi:hypothetical protein